MRIVIASSGLGHVARGIEAWAADLGRALAERSEQVLLYKGGGRPEATYERVVPCLARHSVQTRRLLSVLPRRFFWRLGLATPHGVEQATFTLGLLWRLRRDRVDVLHVQDPLLAVHVQLARRLGLVKTRAVLGHGTMESLEFLQKVDYLQHLAPCHLEEAKRAGVWKETWTAIPNFVDTEKFTPAGEGLRSELAIPADGLVVLTVAAIDRRVKRIDSLIEEFAHLWAMRPELPVWLIVAGGWEQETDELVRWGKQRLGERVRFLVRFPRERMPELYRTADAFALCSLKEMMPIAVLEAMASGVPCLVNRHPVLEWVVGPGGEAVDMAVKGGLARAMEGMLVDPARRRELGKRARNHCVEDFGKEPVVNRIVEYYRFVVGDKKNEERGARTQPVSVIIPTFNSAAMVVEAVESVLGQTVPAHEIIVVDDGSTDETAHALAPYFDRIRYLKQENRGVAAARNRGIAEATGDLVAFLDADDVWHPRKLELQLEVMSQNPRLGLLGTDVCDWPAPQYPAVPERPAGRVATVSWRNLVVRNHFTTSSVIVRRDVLEKLDLFDTDLHGPEDHDLWLRLAEAASVGNLLLPLTGYRHVNGSLSQRAATMEAGMRRILHKVEQRGGWRGRPLLRRKAFSYLEYSCAYLHKSVGHSARALRHVYRSLLKYPMPYRPSEVRLPLARLRLVLALWRQPGGAIPPLTAPPVKEINCG